MDRNYDAWAEEFCLLLLKLDDVNNEKFIMRADTSTNMDWNIVSIDRNSGKQTTYQVKELNWSKQNKAINGNFPRYKNKLVDYLLIVILFSDEGIIKQKPVVFQIPFGSISEKRDGKDSIGASEICYSSKTDIDQIITNKWKEQGKSEEEIKKLIKGRSDNSRTISCGKIFENLTKNSKSSSTELLFFILLLFTG